MEKDDAVEAEQAGQPGGRFGGAVSRRMLLRGGGAALTAAALGPVLASCGSGGETAASSGASVAGSGGTSASGSSGTSTSGSSGTSASGSSGTSAGGSTATSGKKVTLTVWWNSGFYDSEDQAVKKMASAWEKKTGNKVDLQFYSTQEIPKKEQAAVTSGVLPDVVAAEKGKTATYAYNGLLADTSDGIDSANFTDGAKKAVFLYDSKDEKAGYHAIPLDQFTVPLFFWKDMLTKAGGDPNNLPSGWDDFWKVFTDAQSAYNDKTGKDVQALGWAMSSSAGDTGYDTQMALMAYGGNILTKSGALNTDGEGVRDGVVNAFKWLHGLYKNGFVPKDVVNWKDSGNNTAFLNKQIIATPNGSLSIPGAVKDKNKKKWKNIVTQDFPNKPDGSGPAPVYAQVHNAVIFKDSPHKEEAKDFMSFVSQPDNMITFLKGGHGRWHPVTSDLLKSDYFAKSDDPNIAASTKMLMGPTEPAWLTVSVGFSDAERNGLYGKALGKMALQGSSPEDATDWVFGQLKQSFDKFPVKSS